MKFLSVIVVAVLLMACVKPIDYENPGASMRRLASPTITITSPRDGQRVSAGQVLSITATLTDDKQLEKVRMFVTSRATGTEVLHLEKYLDVKSYSLSESFTPATGLMYTIEIQAADLNNNNTKTRIGVTCN